eukprot:scaffold3941_cov412-Prasinococcus_capsulatus_cf.AAC.9
MSGPQSGPPVPTIPIVLSATSTPRTPAVPSTTSGSTFHRSSTPAVATATDVIPETPPATHAPPDIRVIALDEEPSSSAARVDQVRPDSGIVEFLSVVGLACGCLLVICLCAPSLIVIAVLDELARVLYCLFRIVSGLVLCMCTCTISRDPPPPVRERLIITVLREIFGCDVGTPAPYTPSTERGIGEAMKSIEDRDADPIEFTEEEADALAAELDVDHLCPISRDVMHDPVKASDGNTYERLEIRRWMRRRMMSPLTNEELSSTKLVQNTEMRKSIEDALGKMRVARAAEGRGAELEIQSEGTASCDVDLESGPANTKGSAECSASAGIDSACPPAE